MKRAEGQAAARQDTLLQRLDGVERTLRAHVEQTGNSLAASIGEVDDRVERMERARGLTPPQA